jgi:ceroid-lipofuscinosis MFS transporter 7
LIGLFSVVAIGNACGAFCIAVEEALVMNGAQSGRASASSSTTREGRDELEMKRSMNAVLATMFLSALGFTIFIPMLWFYYQNFSECLCSCSASPAPLCTYCPFPNATAPDTNGACDCPMRDSCAIFLGYIVSGFPLGQFVFSPIFGWWGSKRNMREVLIFSLIVNAVGYVMFSVVTTGWLLLFARFVIGMGGANTAVLRAYASMASSEDNRTAVMAKMSAAQSFGFLLGPGLGFLFAFKQFSFSVGGLIVNQYTAAGFAAAFIIMLNLVVLLIFFKDIKHDASSTSPSNSIPAKMDVPAVITLMTFFFSCVFVFSVYEGVATQITENNYNWQWKLNGIYLTACGAMSIAGFVALKPLEARIGSRQVMVTAMVLAALSYIPLCDKIFPDHFVPLWAYIMSSLLLSFGYPTAQAMSLVLFTKIIPTSKQGLMMGLLTSTGSVARM